jgi:hypothetical protein
MKADAQSGHIFSDTASILLFSLQSVGPKPIYILYLKPEAGDRTPEILVTLTSILCKDFGAK